MFDQLRARGFDIAIRNHAGAILSVDFPEIANELVSALLSVSIPAEELIKSGGGEAIPQVDIMQAIKNPKGPSNIRFTERIRIVDHDAKIIPFDELFRPSPGRIFIFGRKLRHDLIHKGHGFGIAPCQSLQEMRRTLSAWLIQWENQLADGR